MYAIAVISRFLLPALPAAAAPAALAPPDRPALPVQRVPLGLPDRPALPVQTAQQEPPALSAQPDLLVLPALLVPPGRQALLVRPVLPDPLVFPVRKGLPGRLGLPVLPALLALLARKGLPGRPGLPVLLARKGLPGRLGLPVLPALLALLVRKGLPGRLGLPVLPALPVLLARKGLPDRPGLPELSRLQLLLRMLPARTTWLPSSTSFWPICAQPDCWPPDRPEHRGGRHSAVRLCSYPGIFQESEECIQMKVVVYAICRNEAQFADRWMDSVQEADQVVVLDTGSTDDTADRLQRRGALVVEEQISPWRFDTARNRSLELVPEDADICVCIDLDEVFHPGWRKALENAWKADTAQASYRYTWSFKPDGSEGVIFWSEKIHSRHGWRWIHPVHEVLEWTEEASPRRITVEGVQVDHHPDPSKSRGQYLPLLELSVAEAPEDDRNVHYLGREYMYKGRWEDCIRTLERHLSMPTALWADERAASMRYIALSSAMLGRRQAARDWYLRAIAQAPHLREPYLDLARFLYENEEWEGVLYFTGCALSITNRPRSYICEAEAWGSLPHDLRSIAFYRTGRLKEALAEARLALELEPSNSRLEGNVRLLEKISASV